MDRATALLECRQRVERYGVTLGAIKFAYQRRRGIFGRQWYVRATSSAGELTATIDENGVAFAIEPDYRDAQGRMLPLWLARPSYTSMTMGWREGHGEVYKLRWHAWWRTLDDEARRTYRVAYPEPAISELHWSGFYDSVAEVPTSGTPAEHILGRV